MQLSEIFWTVRCHALLSHSVGCCYSYWTVQPQEAKLEFASSHLLRHIVTSIWTVIEIGKHTDILIILWSFPSCEEFKKFFGSCQYNWLMNVVYWSITYFLMLQKLIRLNSIKCYMSACCDYITQGLLVISRSWVVSRVSCHWGPHMCSRSLFDKFCVHSRLLPAALRIL